MASKNVAAFGTCGSPSGVYSSVAKMLTTKKIVPSMISAMPVMKIAPARALNCVKSAGSGQYSVYSGA